VSGIAALIGVAVAASLLLWYRGPFKRWIAMGIALACMLPYFLWEVIAPRPIDLTAYTETVDYEFRDAEYAEEFAALNQAPSVSDPD
jgi:hypothetical protein